MSLLTVPASAQDLGYTADELIAKIRDREQRIGAISAQIKCAILSDPEFFFYEFEWGYDGGREFINGTTFIWGEAEQAPVAVKTGATFDGGEMRSYTFRQGEKNHPVRSGR